MAWNIPYGWHPECLGIITTNSGLIGGVMDTSCFNSFWA